MKDLLICDDIYNSRYPGYKEPSCTLIGNVRSKEASEWDQHDTMCFQALTNSQLCLYSLSDFSRAASLSLLLSRTTLHFATTTASSTAFEADSNDAASAAEMSAHGRPGSLVLQRAKGVYPRGRRCGVSHAVQNHMPLACGSSSRCWDICFI